MINVPERRANEPASLIDRDAKVVKTTYTTLTLRTFGAVNQLTTGTYSGAGFDMTTMRYVMWN
jgi:hypothetical protein